MTPLDTANFLKTVKIFSETPDEILVSLAPQMQPVEASEGSPVIQKGELGDCMYIIASGRVRIHDGNRTVNFLQAGDIFGEMALLDDEPRTASVTADEDTCLLRLSRETFYELLSKQVEVGRGILRVLTRYLRASFLDLSREFAYQLELERRVQEQLREIAAGQLATIFALSRLAESRDIETGRHLERVREYCTLLAHELRRQPGGAELVDDHFIEMIYSASPLHDIGKVGIPDNILQKTGKLTPEEFAIMKTHTLIGGSTLRAVMQQFPGNELLRYGIEIAENHHERWDGSGYPNGLAGTDIPLSARILALADVYDALTSERPYKAPLSHTISRELIVLGCGTQFDPALVDCFLEVEEQFQAVRTRLEDKNHVTPFELLL